MEPMTSHSGRTRRGLRARRSGGTDVGPAGGPGPEPGTTRADTWDEEDSWEPPAIDGGPPGTGGPERPAGDDDAAFDDPFALDDPSAPDEEGSDAARERRQTGRRVGQAAGRGAAATARATGRASRYTVRQARRASHAEGAGESGLFRLLEMHAFGAAGDAAVAISLAGTLFFQVPTGEARGQVGLFLLLTMLPFAIVAPLIGPFLDRFSHGRRWAIGSTMAVRAFLCWVLAGAVATESRWLFPAALGVLVASKAYGVTKAAAVPRLLPASLTLVKANGRTSLAGVVGALASAPIAAVAATVGPEWSLRYAFVLFAVGTVLAIMLPAQVDSTLGEEPAALMPTARDRPGPGRARGRDDDGLAARLLGRGTGIPGTVAFALRANCGPRFLSGFLIMFMAFLLREQPIGGLSPELLLALVTGAAIAGNTLGVALAALLRSVNPLVTVVVVLAADVAMALLAAVFYGLLPVVLLGLTAGVSQSLAKLSLDSTIQRDVPDRVRTSAFARSDALLQLAWVLGGFVGIVMPLIPRLGLGIGCAVLAGWLVLVVASRPTSARAAPGPPRG